MMFSATRVTVMALAAAGIASLVATNASAQANCDWYAQTALRQQQDNVRLKCGFVGPAWTSDLKAHQAWCGGVAPDKAKSEAQIREQQIQACGAKAK